MRNNRIIDAKDFKEPNEPCFYSAEPGYSNASDIKMYYVVEKFYLESPPLIYQDVGKMQGKLIWTVSKPP